MSRLEAGRRVVAAQHLLTAASSLSVVELLIMAHDCFSLTCNMEGIVRVLQAARHLSHAHLAPGEHFSLLASPAHSRRQINFLFFAGWSPSGAFWCLFAGAAADGYRQVQRDDLRPGPAAPEPPLRDPAEEEGGCRQAAGSPRPRARFPGSRIDDLLSLTPPPPLCLSRRCRVPG